MGFVERAFEVEEMMRARDHKCAKFSLYGRDLAMS